MFGSRGFSHQPHSPDFSPWGLYLDHACTASFSNLSHAHAENAIDSNDDFIAVFNEVDHTEFHPATAGAADWKSHGIAGP